MIDNEAKRDTKEISGLLGRLPEDPDSLPTTPPSGLFFASGSCWSGTFEIYPLINVRVTKCDRRLDFVMTADQARDVILILQKALAAAEASVVEAEETIEF